MVDPFEQERRLEAETAPVESITIWFPNGDAFTWTTRGHGLHGFCQTMTGCTFNFREDGNVVLFATNLPYRFLRV